jgi:hypothetical protein
MAIVPRNVLKSFFQTGDKPTAAQFSTMLDSVLIYSDDRELVGLKDYDPALVYVQSDTVIFNKVIYQANTTTVPGPFNINLWDKIAGSTPGSVNYKGTWDASSNNPDISASSPELGDYYVVSVAGNTPLNTPPNVINDWAVGDWAIYNGTLWEKVDNTDSLTDAANVGTGAGVFKTKNATVLQFRSLTGTSGSLLLNENTDEVDVNINFGDSGTSVNRAWSAFKINAELNTREPANPNIQAHIADVTTNPHNVTKTQVGLGNVENTLMNFTAAADPSATDDNTLGYTVGSVWINTSSQTEFTCMDATTGAAVWQTITADPNIQLHIANMNNPHNTTKAQVGLANVENIKVNLSSIVDPQPSNDNTEGYAIGSTWINSLFDRQFTCFDASTGAASWIEITADPNIQAHIANMNNPHNTTKAQVGLGNADDTSDVNKPVSTAQAAADAAVLASANAYADSIVVGLLNDRGNYDASGNTFPTTGGSGSGGAIKKGDLWTIDTPGILGGQNVEIGDVIRALQNAPGQTASKWAITQNNIGYVAENAANRLSAFQPTPDNLHYISEKLAYDQLALKEPTITGTGNTTDFWSGAKTFRNLASDVRAVTLTGLSIATNQVISATDTILQAFGYLQKQVTDVLTTLTSHIGNSSNPHNVTKAQVGLPNVQDIKVNYTAVTDPAVGNDNTQGYAAGSTWINTATGKEFVCVNAATGAANWREITNPAPSVFGNNYAITEAQVSSTTTLTTFQACQITTGVTMTLSTGALPAGTYRLQWSCVITNNNKQGEYRLVDNTVPASPVVLGQTLAYDSSNATDKRVMTMTEKITLLSPVVNKDYIIQFRAISTSGGNTQTIAPGAKMEFFRVL